MKRVLFAPGFACTSEIWSGLSIGGIEPLYVRWESSLETVSAARVALENDVVEGEPDVYVEHSLGGLLLLELLIAERIPSRPTLIIDAFLDDPADMFKNYVWEDDKLRDTVVRMLDAQRPLFVPLRRSIGEWTRSGWPEAAIETGAHFVYGGRGGTEEEVLEALMWPQQARKQITILPKTSHFLMMEAPKETSTLIELLLGE